MIGQDARWSELIGHLTAQCELSRLYYCLKELHSVFSATQLIFITALFREPKAREDLQLGLKVLIGSLYTSYF
jgi:hypothetical protein